jgi:hypothetical protein
MQIIISSICRADLEIKEANEMVGRAAKVKKEAEEDLLDKVLHRYRQPPLPSSDTI